VGVGLRVPEDLYIAGFGNTMISAISKPPNHFRDS
jgi:DNA-binding LacI/PurR family transcriptional regulator